MTRTYQAILDGNRVEWTGDAPASRGPVPVRVTLDEPSEGDVATPGAEMARLLEELSRLDPFRDIEDPAAWQREIRQDRPLPGREG